MDVAQWWIIDIVLPAILLIVLIWLVMKRRSSRSEDELSRGSGDGTEAATRDLYREEEMRRREGTDQAEE
ncbi:MAG: hypothetical protein ACJ8FO_05105 [Sphingomicrobium sp.]